MGKHISEFGEAFVGHLASWFVSMSAQHRLFLTLQITLGLWALRWTTQKRLPPPGYAVAFIAVVAAVMSIQGDMLGWQKAIWMLVIGGFLIVELRSISADRSATNLQSAADRHKEDSAFAAVIKGQADAFAATAQTLQTVIQNGQRQFAITVEKLEQSLQLVRGTLEQTKPNAYVRFTYFFFLQDKRHTWQMGLPFGAKLGFRNEGNESADEVWKAGNFYIGANSDSAVEESRVLFDLAWDTEKQGPSFLGRADERFCEIRHPGFSVTEMAAVLSGEKVIYFLFRAEYRDRNGRWGTTVCRKMYNPLIEDEIQCPPINGRIYNDPRYEVTSQ